MTRVAKVRNQTSILIGARQIAAVKSRVRLEPQASLLLRLIDGFFWVVKRIPVGETSWRAKREERLEALLKSIKEKDFQVQNLQRAVLEIPELADPNDREAIDAVAILVDHENRRLRNMAYRSISRLGGQVAEGILSKKQGVSDQEAQKLAQQGLEFSRICELVRELEAVVSLERVQEIDRCMAEVVHNTTKPYKRVIRALCTGYLVISVELFILLAYFLYEVVL